MYRHLQNIALLLAVLLFPLGQIGRIPLTNGTTPFYLFEVFLVVTLAMLIFHYRTKPFYAVATKGFAMPIAMFLTYMSAALALSLIRYDILQNTVALLYLLRLAVYFLFIVYSGYAAMKKEVSLKVLVYSSWYIGLVSVIGAIGQYFWYPDLRNLYYAGWDPHYFRVFGLYFEPVIAAVIFGLLLLRFALPTEQHAYSIKHNDIVKRVAGYLFAVSCFILFMGTFSRGAYIGLVLAGIMAVGNRITMKVWACAALIVFFAAAVLFLIPKPSGEGVNLLRTSTIASRFADYNEGITLWRSHPVFGVGYNHIRAEKRVPTTHNQSSGELIPNNAAGSFHSTFLIVLVTGGVIGLFLFGNVLGGLFLTTVDKRFTAAALVFLSVASFFDNILFHPFALFLFAILWAKGAHAQERKESEVNLLSDI